MKLQIIIIALSIAFSSQGLSASLENTAFLSGCWSVQDDGVTVSEIWTKSSQDLMQGISQTKSSDQRVISYEFLRIEKRRDGKVAYTPYINGKQANDFILDEQSQIDASKYVATFVNDQNDFPKKISYSQPKTDSSAIFVRLEGSGQDGKLQVVEYPLFAADCNELL